MNYLFLSSIPTIQMNSQFNKYKLSEDLESKLLFRLAKILTYSIDTYKEKCFEICSSKSHKYVIRLNLFFDNYLSGYLYQINLVTNDIEDISNFTYQGVFNSSDFLNKIIRNRLLHKYEIHVNKILNTDIQMSKIQYRIQKFNETSQPEIIEDRKFRRREEILRRKEEILSQLEQQKEIMRIHPRNESERKQAIIERKIFNDPSKWKFHLSND